MMFPFNKWGNILAISLEVILAIFIGYKYKKIRKDEETEVEPEYEIIFIPFEVKGNSLNDASFNFPTIEKFINEAKYSLDLCFYKITDVTIMNVIVEAKKRGVKVRLIVDYKDGFLENESINNILKADIPVYILHSQMMHTKFCIRDDSSALIGSMNLTTVTLSIFYDSCIITNDELLVKPCRRIFNDLIEDVIVSGISL